MMVYTGGQMIVAYEDPNDATRLIPIGVGAKIGTFEHNYQVERAYGIGDRTADVLYSKGFEGSLSFDLILDDNNTELVSKWVDLGCIEDMDIIVIQTNCDVLSSDVTVMNGFRLVGFKPDSIKIVARSGEHIGLSFDGKFRYSLGEDWSAAPKTLIVSSLVAMPLTFAHAVLSDPTSAWKIDFDLVKEFEIDIKHSLETLRAIGDLYPKVLQEQKAEIDMTLNVYLNSTTWFEIVTHVQQGDSYKNGVYPSTQLKLAITGVNTTYEFVIDGVAMNTFSNSIEDANVIEGQMKLIGKTVALTISS